MNEPLKPLEELEAKAHKKFEEEFEKWLNEKKAFEAVAKKGMDEREIAERWHEINEKKPRAERYLVNDCTIEKLGELLKDNPYGLLLIRDELHGMLSTFTGAGHEGDRAFFLQSWNGYGRHVFDRIGRGSVPVDNLCVSILGAITPGPLMAYLREAFSGEQDDGLLQRFQLAVYPDLSPEWENIDRLPLEKAKQQAWELFQRFIDYGKGGDGTPQHILRFAPDAQEYFNNWRTEWKNESAHQGMNTPSCSPTLESTAA